MKILYLKGDNYTILFILFSHLKINIYLKSLLYAFRMLIFKK